jgi:hypothetical protein
VLKNLKKSWSSQCQAGAKSISCLIWHSGARKSEAYERVKEEIEITETHVIVDFHQRKKHGETVPARAFRL